MQNQGAGACRGNHLGGNASQESDRFNIHLRKRAGFNALGVYQQLFLFIHSDFLQSPFHCGVPLCRDKHRIKFAFLRRLQLSLISLVTMLELKRSNGVRVRVS